MDSLKTCETCAYHPVKDASGRCMTCWDHNRWTLDTHLLETFDVKQADPKGLDQHTPGAKLDHGKVRLGLVLRGFAKAILWVAKVGTFGANKYTPNGWLEVENGIERYTDAMYRHLNAYERGEEIDPESGLPHLAHAAWNALAVLELTEKGKEIA